MRAPCRIGYHILLGKKGERILPNSEEVASLFDNIKPIDPVAQRRRRRTIAVAAFCLMLAGYGYFEFKNFPEEHKVSQFFQALQQKEYDKAYRLWQPASSYSFKDFSQDWGPDGLQGPVKEFHITGSTARGTGVVVRVMVNNSENVSLGGDKRQKPWLPAAVGTVIKSLCKTQFNAQKGHGFNRAENGLRDRGF